MNVTIAISVSIYLGTVIGLYEICNHDADLAHIKYLTMYVPLIALVYVFRIALFKTDLRINKLCALGIYCSYNCNLIVAYATAEYLKQKNYSYYGHEKDGTYPLAISPVFSHIDKILNFIKGELDG